MSSYMQVWAPIFDVNPYDEKYSRDLQRAEKEWKGEDRIWLIPGAHDVVRWTPRPLVSECIIPSESFNQILVHNIDENRRVFPPITDSRDRKNILPARFYREWLNAQPEAVTTSDECQLSVPEVVDDTVTYRDRIIRVEPGPFFPVMEGPADAREVRLAWPPGDAPPLAPISPEAESRSRFGPLTWEGAKAVALKKDPKQRALPLSFKWPKPFDILFPNGSGIDVVHHHVLMRQCVVEWENGKRNEVEREADSWLDRLSSSRETTLWAASFLPKFYGSPDIALYEAGRNHGIFVSSIRELASRRDFRESSIRLVPVRRFYGWLGYFWWELRRDLTAEVPARECENCGNVIVGGHRDRRFCTPNENSACFRQRNAAAQRKRRNRLASSQSTT